MHPSHVLEFGVFHAPTGVGLLGDSSQGLTKVANKGLWSRRTVGGPPRCRLRYLVGRSSEELQPTTFHSRRSSSSRNCSPSSSRKSPSSASRTACASLDSSSGVSSISSSGSGRNTVTVEPSTRDSPSTTTFPSITVPLATRIVDCTSNPPVGVLRLEETKDASEILRPAPFVLALVSVPAHSGLPSHLLQTSTSGFISRMRSEEHTSE